MTTKDGTEAVVALLGSLLGRVEVKEMFDAAGLYLDGTQFGLISDGRLLFRTDQRNRGDYDPYVAAADDAFCVRAELPGDLPWRAVPGAVLDEPERLREYALNAWEAAKRARKG